MNNINSIDEFVDRELRNMKWFWLGLQALVILAFVYAIGVVGLWIIKDGTIEMLFLGGSLILAFVLVLSGLIEDFRLSLTKDS